MMNELTQYLNYCMSNLAANQKQNVSRAKGVTNEAVIAALSTTEWMRIQEISDITVINCNTVRCCLVSRLKVEGLVESMEDSTHRRGPKYQLWKKVSES